MSLIQILEPRTFKKKQQILSELDECLEIYFVLRGSFEAGFSINNKKIYRLMYSQNKTIGAFNVVFNKRSQYLIRASSLMNCFGCRKRSFLNLLDLYPEFGRQLKIIIFSNYDRNFRKPLLKKKRDLIIALSQRKDYNQILVLDNQDE